MKKKVKPSPLVLIITGVFAVLCIGVSLGEFADTGTSSAATIALDALVIFGFGLYLYKYCSQSVIEFDESTFTVDEVTYGFDEITEVTVKSEQIIRGISTLKVTLFKGEEEIASFTRDDDGGKDFIAEMKKHGVSVSIDV